jgi:hypothetical protein
MSETPYIKTIISTPFPKFVSVINMTDLRSRFDDMNAYFDNIVSMDTAREHAITCSNWLLESPVVQEIGYDPHKSLIEQPDCLPQYFELLKTYGVPPAAEEYLTTRGWFMRGTVSAPLLLTVALSGKGKYVYATAGNFPEDLVYILSA